MTRKAATEARRPSWWDAPVDRAPNSVPEPVATDSETGTARTAATPLTELDKPVEDFSRSANDPTERAALIAEGAGVPRAWAEGFAVLCAISPPAGFWTDRW